MAGLLQELHGTRGVVVLAGGVTDARRVAQQAESAGFAMAWSGEFLHRSAMISVAGMAAGTATIGVGTSIAYATGRSPLVLANDARALDELAGGRFVLGLGTGTRRMMTDWHGLDDPDAPALRVEELVPLLRRLWRLHEGPVSHDGRFHSLDITPTMAVPPPVRVDIPVVTAGVNARMVEVAGFCADGLVCHPTATPGYLDQIVRPAIATGAERAGRSPDDVALLGVVITAIHPDRAQARREAAAQIAFYCAPKAYAPVLEAAGFGGVAEDVRAAFRAGDHQAMAAAVPNEMVDAMALAGTEEEVRARLPEMAARYDHTSLYSPSFGLTEARVTENTAAILLLGGRV